MGPRLEKGCNPDIVPGWGAGDSAVSKPDLSHCSRSTQSRGQMDWRQRGEGLEKWGVGSGARVSASPEAFS